MNLFDVYSLYDIEPVIGRGNYVYTADGTKYMDLYGGHAVISIGHSHPHYISAVGRQLNRLGFYSNSVKNSLQEEFAELLGQACGYPGYSLFLCNSGAEANENAVKLASFHTGRAKVLAFSGAFHGRTSGAVALTDNPRIVSPFNTTDNVTFCEWGNIEEARRLLSTEEYCAVIIEGIQGVAGIRVPDDEFMNKLSEEAHKYGTLVIADEIQSGYGRTGKFFAHQYSAMKPDIITCAKGIANGFPMGAVLISPDIEARKGMLGTTFGGNHLACAAAIAVLEVMKQENLVENAAEVGSYLMSMLGKRNAALNLRGRGLMIGFDVEGEAADVRKRLLFEQQVFTGGAGKSTVRLLPALSLTKEMAEDFVNRFDKLEL
ncbi:MAG: aminotransferase class III-fold pyridoxal phosphate-dependent enzyme [Paramuribaculum sp.]|nr:aminotransferase class III-fold pyridoxal phosphate-dependent enzyme [Paramuribaculum sp.]